MLKYLYEIHIVTLNKISSVNKKIKIIGIIKYNFKLISGFWVSEKRTKSSKMDNLNTDFLSLRSYEQKLCEKLFDI